MTIIIQLSNFLNNQYIKITGFITGEVVIKWRNVQLEFNISSSLPIIHGIIHLQTDIVSQIIS